jgi:hypothetical protein
MIGEGGNSEGVPDWMSQRRINDFKIERGKARREKTK